MFAVAWEYLTGRAVATDPCDREVAEWPPHPDRVFQALVAGWGECGCAMAEQAGLCWLENLGPPDLAVPEEDNVVLRNPVVKVYVPVNDLEGPRRGAHNEKHLALLPSHRTRKERFFPSVQVGAAICALVWPDIVLPEEHRAALEQLCGRVTCLGHSSSLVRLWPTEQPPPVLWRPVRTGERGSLPLRVPGPGRLSTLIQAYANGGSGWRRPPLARWHGYLRITPGEPIHHGAFDDQLLVLRQVAGERLDLRQVLLLTDALRKTLIPHANGQTVEMISGHQPDGRPSCRPHVAYLPLAFVGSDHADGHLLGMALALPAGLGFDEGDAVMATLFRAMDKERLTLTLTMGRIGTATLAVDDYAGQPLALRSATWTRPSRCWGSVTPIVLDRMPPRTCKDADSWAASQIADSCERQGLPRPDEVGVMLISPCRGTPKSSDFLPIVSKDGQRRWHIHATLSFQEPVAGPLLLGAGRYRGYGLCRPLQGQYRP